MVNKNKKKEKYIIIMKLTRENRRFNVQKKNTTKIFNSMSSCSFCFN